MGADLLPDVHIPEDFPELIADVARDISGRTNIPVVLYPDSSHQVEPGNADVEAKLRELKLI
ncbi:hypothetical protein [Nesterenkonia alba]|uniref:hypothetical protein n=1 Tax=Nesterenkonia alba TaxID=515814 RepID=UPI001FE22BF2|nr:hypothetical protein [Nesterenkonia alba]